MELLLGFEKIGQKNSTRKVGYKSHNKNKNVTRQRTYSEVKEETIAAKPCSFGRDYKAFYICR